MKNKLFCIVTGLALFSIPSIGIGQSINLNSAANFVLFSSDGPLSNTGTSAISGDVGTNNGASTGFGTLIGTIHDMNGTSATAAADLLSAYNQINTTTATLISVSILGNGQVITAGSYSLSTAASINNTLTLDGGSNPNSVFIIQVGGALSANSGAVVKLINGALACNVFWKVEGLISLGAGTVMKGTMIANNAAIDMYAGVVLEGRALTTSGAVGVDGITAMLSTGCGTTSGAPAVTSQPSSTAVCPGQTAIFSVGASGSGLTYQWRKGSVNLTNGANISGATSSALVINAVTSAEVANDYNVVVTGAASPAANSSSVSLSMKAIPSITAQPMNQYQCVDYPVYFSVHASGVNLTYQWRRGTTNLTNGGNISGADKSILTINPMYIGDVASDYNVVVTGDCAPAIASQQVSLTACTDVGLSTQSTSFKSMSVYPNPFTTVLNITANDDSQINHTTLKVYSLLGTEVLNLNITKKTTHINTALLPAGVYFYNVIMNDKTVQTGKLVSE